MSGVYVNVSTQIDYHQALKALEQLIAEREPARFSEWDIQRLEGLVTAVKEKLHERPLNYFIGSIPGSNVGPYFPPGHTQISTAPPEPSAGGSY